MKLNTTIKTLSLTAAVAMTLTFTNDAQAQRSGSHGYHQPTYTLVNSSKGRPDSIRREVARLDMLSHQMVRSFANDPSTCNRCRSSQALIKTMKVYNAKVDALACSYNGHCRTSFRKAVFEAQSALSSVQSLVRRIPTVNYTVKSAVKDSSILTANLSRNVNSFNPVVVVNKPGYAHTPSYNKPSPVARLVTGLIKKALY